MATRSIFLSISACLLSESTMQRVFHTLWKQATCSKWKFLENKASFFFIFINFDWPRLRFDDGVAFVSLFRSKTWGPCNKLKVLEQEQTDLTSWCLKLYMMYCIMRFLSVAKHYQIAWPTVLCWWSWRCSLHSNLKQEIMFSGTPPLKNRIKSLHASCI